MINKYYRVFILNLLVLSGLSAGTIRSQGTAGAAQLLIPVGAENIAMGGANAAGVSGVGALYLNPAGTANSPHGFQGTVSDMNYLADIGVSYAGFVTKIEGIGGSVGLSVKSLDFGDIPVTTADETEGTGEFYSPGFYTMTANYGRVIADNVRFGFNLKFISEKIMNTDANGLGLDLGVQYTFNQLPITVGIALRNLGQRMEYTGSDLEQTNTPEGSESGSIVERFRIKSESFELPAQLDMALNYEPISGFELMGSFTNNSFSANTINFAGKYEIMGMAWVGGGMSMISVIDEQGDTSDDDWTNWTESIFGATFGAGVSVPLGEVSLDVGYSIRTVASYFQNNNVLELTLNF